MADDALITLEEQKTGTLLRRRYRLVVCFGCEDFEQFLPCYNALSDALVQWYAKRDKRCGDVRVEAHIHPWIAGRVREYVRDLRKRPEHSPLRHLPLHIVFKTDDGVLEERLYEPVEA
ncbi:hypothetical protein S7S_08065 [Isoalcanivorax pacificus W11-5]|uniref:Uncharacterized protein n=1 Tax=Isoalcanivorax pacificus W11-5 TaxID=391936 RepID=A0A0B4XIH5_9GAMM|nr:hypothetical protein [Isoalcanivorax pacificus]AJD48029.1 hypothetical protein S7S_08065 [Isoalcanivorax pacificus W11-5]